MQVVLEVTTLPSILPVTANGNNVVVMCSCGKPFLLSSMVDYFSGSRCPNCHDTVVHLKSYMMKGKKIEKQSDVVFQLAGQQWPIDAKPQTETAKKRSRAALKVAA